MIEIFYYSLKLFSKFLSIYDFAVEIGFLNFILVAYSSFVTATSIEAYFYNPIVLKMMFSRAMF